MTWVHKYDYFQTTFSIIYKLEIKILKYVKNVKIIF